MDSKLFSDPEFKKAFWDWFDSVPREFREKYKNQKDDGWAEMYFYNQVWSKR